ncbi:MAG: hypothetical protein WCL10_20345 [Novosphingobium sp.]|jgi:hypothetical protein|uniref:hypothetical protein n=1 Tax=Novosphingobium sp. TaxID=1874826 RepID=UPI003018B009
MSRAEERILGVISMAAIRLGADVTVDAVGNEAFFKATIGDKQATLWLQLDGGTEMIKDATGDEDLCVTLGEFAQNECDDIWRDE